MRLLEDLSRLVWPGQALRQFDGQGGRFAAMADEPVEPDEPLAVPPVMPEPDEPLPVALPEVLAVPDELPEAAVLSFALPCASLQWVAADMLLFVLALGVLDDWAEAASIPPARKADANSTILKDFIVPLLGFCPLLRSIHGVGFRSSRLRRLREDIDMVHTPIRGHNAVM